MKKKNLPKLVCKITSHDWVINKGYRKCKRCKFRKRITLEDYITSVLGSDHGLSKIAKAMTKPLKNNLDYKDMLEE